MIGHALLLAAVALGGGLGAVARFWVSAAVGRRLGEGFPWGTLTVNVTGAGLIGVLAGVLLAPGSTAHGLGATGQPSLWAGLVIGGLGSYTTVSSFSVQTLALLRNRRAGRALANVALSLALCLGVAAATWAGTLQLLAGRAGP